MSSSLLVNVSLLRTPLPLGSIASSLAASVASSYLSLSDAHTYTHPRYSYKELHFSLNESWIYTKLVFLFTTG